MPSDVSDSRECERRSGVARPLLWMAQAPGLRFDGDRDTFEIGANNPKRGAHSKYLKYQQVIKLQIQKHKKILFRWFLHIRSELLETLPFPIDGPIVFPERVVELYTRPDSRGELCNSHIS